MSFCFVLAYSIAYRWISLIFTNWSCSPTKERCHDYYYNVHLSLYCFDLMSLQHIPFKRTLKGARSYLLSFKNAQAWKRNQFIPKRLQTQEIKNWFTLWSPRRNEHNCKSWISRDTFFPSTWACVEKITHVAVCRCIRWLNVILFTISTFLRRFAALRECKEKLNSPKLLKPVVFIFTLF